MPGAAVDLASRFFELLDARRWDEWSQLLDPDVVYELPQSRERIRGADRYLRFNEEYPGDWHLRPQVVTGDDHDAAVMFEWLIGDDPPQLAVTFVEVAGGRITKLTDFWPEPYEPPPGREHLVERW